MRITGKMNIKGVNHQFEFEGTDGDLEYLTDKGLTKLHEAFKKVLAKEGNEPPTLE